MTMKTDEKFRNAFSYEHHLYFVNKDKKVYRHDAGSSPTWYEIPESENPHLYQAVYGRWIYLQQFGQRLCDIVAPLESNGRRKR